MLACCRLYRNMLQFRRIQQVAPLFTPLCGGSSHDA